MAKYEYSKGKGVRVLLFADSGNQMFFAPAHMAPGPNLDPGPHYSSIWWVAADASCAYVLHTGLREIVEQLWEEILLAEAPVFRVSERADFWSGVERETFFEDDEVTPD